MILRHPGITVDQILALARVHEKGETQPSATTGTTTGQGQKPLGAKREPGTQEQTVEGMRVTSQCSQTRRCEVDVRRCPCNQELHAATCLNCGHTSHPIGGCPARDHRCPLCGTRGHYAAVCRGGPKRHRRRRWSPGRWSPPAPGKGAARLEALRCRRQTEEAPEDVEGDEEVFCVSGGWEGAGSRGQRPTRVVKIAQSEVTAMVDTGATVDLMGEGQRARLHPRPKLERTTMRVYTYGGEVPIPIRGTATVEVAWNRRKLVIKFYIVIGRFDTVVGCDTAMVLGLIAFTTPCEPRDTWDLEPEKEQLRHKEQNRRQAASRRGVNRRQGRCPLCVAEVSQQHPRKEGAGSSKLEARNRDGEGQIEALGVVHPDVDQAEEGPGARRGQAGTPGRSPREQSNGMGWSGVGVSGWTEEMAVDIWRMTHSRDGGVTYGQDPPEVGGQAPVWGANMSAAVVLEETGLQIGSHQGLPPRVSGRDRGTQELLQWARREPTPREGLNGTWPKEGSTGPPVRSGGAVKWQAVGAWMSYGVVMIQETTTGARNKGASREHENPAQPGQNQELERTGSSLGNIRGDSDVVTGQRHSGTEQLGRRESEHPRGAVARPEGAPTVGTGQ